MVSGSGVGGGREMNLWQKKTKAQVNADKGIDDDKGKDKP